MPPSRRPSLGGPTDSARTRGSAGLKLAGVVFVTLPGLELAETSVLARRTGGEDLGALARVVAAGGAACAGVKGQPKRARVKVRARNRTGLRTMWDIRPLVYRGQISGKIISIALASEPRLW